MHITDWDAFYHSLEIVPERQPLSSPSEELLDSFERRNSLRLPKSYRDFVRVFGAGTFQSSLRIAAPVRGAAPAIYDLPRVHASFSSAVKLLDGLSDGDRSRSARMYYFGLADEHDYLGWDFADVRDATNNEYGIYRIQVPHVAFVADSFRTLVEITCERLFGDNPDWHVEELGPQRSFRPACVGL